MSPLNVPSIRESLWVAVQSDVVLVGPLPHFLLGSPGDSFCGLCDSIVYPFNFIFLLSWCRCGFLVAPRSLGLSGLSVGAFIECISNDGLVVVVFGIW